MDPLTETAVRLYKPSLQRAVGLLRQVCAGQPATSPMYEQLLAASCELEQVLSVAGELADPRGWQDVGAKSLAELLAPPPATPQRERELLHLLTRARMLAQRAKAHLDIASKGNQAAPQYMGDGIRSAATAAEEIDRLARTGVCGCPDGTCEFNAPQKPLRKSVLLVKPQLHLVRDGKADPEMAEVLVEFVLHENDRGRTSVEVHSCKRDGPAFIIKTRDEYYCARPRIGGGWQFLTLDAATLPEEMR